MQVLLTLWILAGLVACVFGYPNGPPGIACQDMFPSGHGQDAQMTMPPYSIELSSYNYTPGSEITVEIIANGTHFAGMFVQARLAESCEEIEAVGNFNLNHNESFLKVLDCFRPLDAVSHGEHQHLNYKNFTWRAPDAAVGHVYLRATVAQNENVFWTDVASAVIRDVSKGEPPSDWKPCSVRKLLVLPTTTPPTTMPPTPCVNSVGPHRAATYLSSWLLFLVIAMAL